ncbi:hypothetical protein Bca52824_001175 [Brassica carinata]|uniref:Uncharacterized protein n=1 Tax=Brassica carinata TaxID=52824 RepID=A0A8X8BCG3_BRACI|nr:hypothetical protein Bca52824_001175 [Brassica carinata]
MEIFRVEVHQAYPGFQPTKSRFNLTAMRYTQVYIIDPLNNRLFMDFKNVHTIPRMEHEDRNYPIDVSNRSVNTYLVNTMGAVFNTKARFDDPASPRMVFYIRDNIDSQIKCVATGDHAYAFRNYLENMRGRSRILVLLIYGLRPRLDYLTSGSIRFCRRLRSSGYLCSTVTLMFRDMWL